MTPQGELRRPAGRLLEGLAQSYARLGMRCGKDCAWSIRESKLAVGNNVLRSNTNTSPELMKSAHTVNGHRQRPRAGAIVSLSTYCGACSNTCTGDMSVECILSCAMTWHTKCSPAYPRRPRAIAAHTPPRPPPIIAMLMADFDADIFSESMSSRSYFE
jgi:hypothetical protein